MDILHIHIYVCCTLIKMIIYHIVIYFYLIVYRLQQIYEESRIHIYIYIYTLYCYFQVDLNILIIVCGCEYEN